MIKTARRNCWLAVVLATCFGNSNETGRIAMHDTSHLRSEDPNVREAVSRRVLDNRQQLIENLVQIAGEGIRGQQKGVARDAIILLGRIRASEAVPFLVEHLEYRVFYKDAKRPQSPEDLYPCMGALIEIGMSAVRPMLERAGRTDRDEVQENIAYVLEKVLGPTLALAALDERIKDGGDRSETERLQQVRGLVLRSSQEK